MLTPVQCSQSLVQFEGRNGLPLTSSPISLCLCLRDDGAVLIAVIEAALLTLTQSFCNCSCFTECTGLICLCCLCAEDEQFREEKGVIIKEISMLDGPPGEPQASDSSSARHVW